MAKQGRHPILDDFKKHEIAAILAVGCSRRTAALYVGCSPETIRQTAQRDAEFAKELRRVEQVAEIGYLRRIQEASEKSQYWRAAAWALERCHPEQYAARSADCITLNQVRQLLSQFAQIVVDEVPLPKYRKSILKRFESLMAGFCLVRSPKKEEKPA